MPKTNWTVHFSNDETYIGAVAVAGDKECEPIHVAAAAYEVVKNCQIEVKDEEGNSLGYVTVKDIDEWMA